MLFRAALAMLLALAISPSQAGSLPDVEGKTWWVLSGTSRHFRQEERDWREFNPGLGIEKATTLDGFYYVGGYFLNSYDRHALYAGVRWMPWKWGYVRFGGYALASTGYPSPVLILPGLSIETERLGMNIVIAPNIREYSGYVGVQLKFSLQ